MYTCTVKTMMGRWKEEGYITICTILRITKNKGVGRMETYLGTSYTTFIWNQRKIFQGDCEISTTVILKSRRRFGA